MISKFSKNFPLLNKCYYIQSCYLSGTTVNCCTVDNCQNGSVVFMMRFEGVCPENNTYYVQYSRFLPLIQPIYLNGLANRTGLKTVNAEFNDGAIFNIKFIDTTFKIGRANIVTPLLSGDFCIIEMNLYQDFYTNDPNATLPVCKEGDDADKNTEVSYGF